MNTAGIHHLGLSVSSLEETSAFFINCLGWSLAREVPEYPAKFVTNGEAFITLWQTSDAAQAFDRKNNVGLHHVAIRVLEKTCLTELFEKVRKYPGVAVDFKPELLRGGPAAHFMVFEPGGIRIEFIWVP